jgi:hypothetical protein
MKNEVKKKMIASSAANAVPKSPARIFCGDLARDECEAIWFAWKFTNDERGEIPRRVEVSFQRLRKTIGPRRGYSCIGIDRWASIMMSGLIATRS